MIKNMVSIGIFLAASVSAAFSTSPLTHAAAISPTQLLFPPQAVAQSKAPTSNQLYLKSFIAKLEEVNKGNPNLPAIVDQIKKDVMSTTTDYTSQFLKKLSAKKNLSQNGGIFSPLVSFFSSLFSPEEAIAATGVPFGGPLTVAYQCTCSNADLIFVGPTLGNLKTSDKLLGYVIGSQAFASYNLPLTPWLLGAYVPGAPVCYMTVLYYCVSVSTQGTISPVVGSSPK